MTIALGTPWTLRPLVLDTTRPKFKSWLRPTAFSQRRSGPHSAAGPLGGVHSLPLLTYSGLPRALTSLTHFYFLILKPLPSLLHCSSSNVFITDTMRSTVNVVIVSGTSLGTRQVSPARCCVLQEQALGRIRTVLPGTGMAPTADGGAGGWCSGQGPILEGCSPMAPDGEVAGKSPT